MSVRTQTTRAVASAPLSGTRLDSTVHIPFLGMALRSECDVVGQTVPETQPIGAPKRTEPEPELKPFNLDGWLEKAKELEFEKNYDAWKRGEGVPDFHWFPNYSERVFAKELDDEKNKFVALLKEMAQRSGATFDKLVTMHTAIAENMEMMKRDPYAQLWRLMKSAMEEAIVSFGLGGTWEWEDGDDDAAQAGEGIDQHGYFRMKRPKKMGKKKRR